MYWVYALRSQVTAKSYVGYTDNLDRRLAEHNSGKHFYTKRYLPWKIFYTEEYVTSAEAITREKYLKSRNGRRFLKKLF